MLVQYRLFSLANGQPEYVGSFSARPKHPDRFQRFIDSDEAITFAQAFGIQRGSFLLVGPGQFALIEDVSHGA